MKKKWIIISLIIIVVFYLALDFIGIIPAINNHFSKASFDKTCNSDSDCRIIAYRCPGSGCGSCDDVICAKGSWENRFCPLPHIMEVPIACYPCLGQTPGCKCISNVCQKV